MVASPEQTEVVRPGREVRQSKVAFPPATKTYLIRVFVDVSDEEVVAALDRTRAAAPVPR